MKNKLWLLLLLLIPFNVFGLEKEEMVYTIMNYDGSGIKTSVTSHLKNVDDDVIYDETFLSNISNINGKEKFTLDNNSLTFDTLHKDIFYKGEYSEKLPIETKIEYYLDDNIVNPKDIEGKSGNIKIVLTFTNNLENDVYIDSVYNKLYTPFLIVSSLSLDTSCSNIYVNNGKVVSNGKKNVVVGLATSGVYESLKLDSLKDTSSIVISYDTSKFSMSDLYLVMKPKLIDNSDLDILDKMDSITSSASSLKSNMDTIVSSYNELNNGIQKLSDASISINSSLKEIYNYLSLISDGAMHLDSGIKEKISELNAKISAFSSLSDQDSLEIINTLISQNNATISSLENVNSTIANYYVDNDLANTSPSYEALAKIKTTYESNLGLITLLKSNNQALSGMISKLNDIKTSLTSLTGELGNSLSDVSNATSLLSSNLSKIKDGVYSLYNGSVEFNDGINTLSNGSVEFYNGLNTYSKEGIDTLYNYSLEASYYSKVVKKLIDLSNSYQGYASSNCDDSIFISKVSK